MKKKLIVFIYLLIHFNCMLHAQCPDSIDPCDDTIGDHIFDEQKSSDIIKAFTNQFGKRLIEYGGTIYADDVQYFKDLATPDNAGNLIIRFYFCQIENNSDGLYIAFGNKKLYRKSGDHSFPYVNSNIFQTHSDGLRNYYTAKNPHYAADQNLDPGVFIKDRNYFITSYKDNRFRSVLKCTNYYGDFNFTKSIEAIYRNKDDQGHQLPGTCAGIRFFFGFDNKLCNQIRIVLVGVDSQGKNLKLWRETSAPKSYVSGTNISTIKIIAYFLFAVLAAILIFFGVRKYRRRKL